MPVILAAWKAEIGKITAPGQPRHQHSQDKKVSETHLNQQVGTMAHTCHPSNARKLKIGRS
jgi:hypothetical protein